MRIGPLRHRVTLQRHVKGRDSWGGISETWEDVATVWASISRTGGKEAFLSAQPQAIADVKMYVRKYDGITSQAWRVMHGDTVYNILAVLPDNRGEYQILLCRDASFEQSENLSSLSS